MPSIDKWYTFLIPSVELCNPSKYISYPFIEDILRTEMTDFPILSCTSTREIPSLSWTWSLKQVPPVQATKANLTPPPPTSQAL